MGVNVQYKELKMITNGMIGDSIAFEHAWMELVFNSVFAYRYGHELSMDIGIILHLTLIKLKGAWILTSRFGGDIIACGQTRIRLDNNDLVKTLWAL